MVNLKIDRVYVSATNKERGDRFVIETTKKATLRVERLVKNPKKKVIHKTSDPRAFSSFYYVDSENYLCFAFRDGFVSIPEDDLGLLVKSIEHFLKIRDIRITDKLEWLDHADKHRQLSPR